MKNNKKLGSVWLGPPLVELFSKFLKKMLGKYPNLGKSYDIADFQNFLRKTYYHNYLKLIISKHKHK